MIPLCRINGSSFMVNPDHIETVEATPDTVILLHNGHRYVVRESPEEIRSLVLAYRRNIMNGIFRGWIKDCGYLPDSPEKDSGCATIAEHVQK